LFCPQEDCDYGKHSFFGKEKQDLNFCTGFCPLPLTIVGAIEKTFSGTMLAAQDSLASRAIPFMTLADGSKVKARMPSELVAVERAALRFAVTGNAIVTGGSGALGLAG
jgi:hypothetical protein